MTMSTRYISFLILDAKIFENTKLFKIRTAYKIEWTKSIAKAGQGALHEGDMFLNLNKFLIFNRKF